MKIELNHILYFVSFHSGTVYIDGKEKITRLPSLKRGSVLSFDTELLQSGKVRVTVEVNDKIVTFDWPVELGKLDNDQKASLGFGTDIGEQDESNSLYFAMKFSNEEWKIGVE